jgi:hypothetical protein
MTKQPHELDFKDHEAGLAAGLAGLLRVMNGRGKVALMGAEHDEAMALLHSIGVALAQDKVAVAHLVGIMHGLLIRQRAEAEAEPEPLDAA